MKKEFKELIIEIVPVNDDVITSSVSFWESDKSSNDSGNNYGED